MFFLTGVNVHQHNKKLKAAVFPQLAHPTTTTRSSQGASIPNRFAFYQPEGGKTCFFLHNAMNCSFERCQSFSPCCDGCGEEWQGVPSELRPHGSSSQHPEASPWRFLEIVLFLVASLLVHIVCFGLFFNVCPTSAYTRLFAQVEPTLFTLDFSPARGSNCTVCHPGLSGYPLVGRIPRDSLTPCFLARPRPSAEGAGGRTHILPHDSRVTWIAWVLVSLETTANQDD